MKILHGIALALLVSATPVLADMQLQKLQGGSTESLDAAALNQKLKALPHKKDAVALVLGLIGGTEETPRVLVDLRSDPNTDFNNATVIVFRDGFQDDSVRGDWHEFKLTRGADGAWSVVTARRAFRCWRGNRSGYSAQLCS